MEKHPLQHLAIGETASFSDFPYELAPCQKGILEMAHIDPVPYSSEDKGESVQFTERRFLLKGGVWKRIE